MAQMISRSYYGGDFLSNIDYYRRSERGMTNRYEPLESFSSDTSPSSESDGKSSGHPRRRIAVACSRCRKRKIKCTGTIGPDKGWCSNCEVSNNQHNCQFLRVHSVHPDQVPPQHGVHPTYRFGPYAPSPMSRPLPAFPPFPADVVYHGTHESYNVNPHQPVSRQPYAPSGILYEEDPATHYAMNSPAYMLPNDTTSLAGNLSGSSLSPRPWQHMSHQISTPSLYTDQNGQRALGPMTGFTMSHNVHNQPSTDPGSLYSLSGMPIGGLPSTDRTLPAPGSSRGFPMSAIPAGLLPEPAPAPPTQVSRPTGGWASADTSSITAQASERGHNSSFSSSGEDTKSVIMSNPYGYPIAPEVSATGSIEAASDSASQGHSADDSHDSEGRLMPELARAISNQSDRSSQNRPDQGYGYTAEPSHHRGSSMMNTSHGALSDGQDYTRAQSQVSRVSPFPAGQQGSIEFQGQRVTTTSIGSSHY